jgi:hypothetical protein
MVTLAVIVAVVNLHRGWKTERSGTETGKEGEEVGVLFEILSDRIETRPRREVKDFFRF